ncbi:MAG: elongation factor Ts [Silvanigrellales bacterium]|jgi:elongation factor Ts|nr:elongation factor Ts [Silvanigrellales bacterium]
MATVTPQMVKELRESTLAGMADCKKALDEAQGDMEKAVVILRERGLASAAKKAGRAASEGVVASVVNADNSKGFLVEVNCETDFVTRNDDFQAFVAEISKTIETKQPADLAALHALPSSKGGTLEEAAKNLVAKIGENIMVRRFGTLGSATTLVTSYVHAGGRVGVLVELAGEGIAKQRTNPALVEVAKDVALQVAAMKPGYLSREGIPAAALESEKEVFATQYRNQGKPENIIPKIVLSRVETWYKEACLVEQPFVKDDGKNVAAHVTSTGKSLGIADLRVVNFIRLELGEGVEKKSVDFATEVAAQIADAKK